MAKTLELARAHFRARLVDAGLDKFVEDYVAIARPALILRPAAAPCERDVTLLNRPHGAANEDDIPLGATKVGGWPDMPRNRPWPGGAFVLQLALAEVPEGVLDLPREGLLTLFADPSQPGTATLDWIVPDMGRLVRTAPPEDAPMFLPRRLTSEFAMTLDTSRPETPMEDDLQDVAFDAVAVPGESDCIQLGGDPHALNPMVEELEDLSPDNDLPEEVREWRLILRVASIEECEMDWGAGLYVWMRVGDLQQRRFENAVAIAQAF